MWMDGGMDEWMDKCVVGGLVDELINAWIIA